MRKNVNGFTIVELLIVVVVIAILATISVVAYSGMQNRANNAAIHSDLANIAKKIELYNAEYGSYPLISTVHSLGLGATKAAYDTAQGIHVNAPPVYNLLYCKNADSTSFALIARSKSGDTFQYSAGSVAPYGGVIGSSSEQLCAGAGITVTTGGWLWFYYHNSWYSWVRG